MVIEVDSSIERSIANFVSIGRLLLKDERQKK